MRVIAAAVFYGLAGITAVFGAAVAWEHWWYGNCRDCFTASRTTWKSVDERVWMRAQAARRRELHGR